VSLDPWQCEPRLETAVVAAGTQLALIGTDDDVSDLTRRVPSTDLSVPLLAACESAVRDRTLADTHAELRLRMTELGRDLVVLGAVVLVLRDRLGVA
jgi:hypothetical protein